MSLKTRVRRRMKIARRAKLRRIASKSAIGVKNEAKTQNQSEANIMIGGAHDPAEKAADQMAAQALADEPVKVTSSQRGVQRVCAECQQDQAKRDANTSSPVASGTHAAPATATASSAIRTLGAGRSLTNTERVFFEPRFDQDFSAVRIHEGATADRAAKNIDARAFTYGQNVAFAKGEREKGGEQMLAHELAHVVQDRGNGKAHRQAAAAPVANCETCPNPVNPKVRVRITPLIQNGTPSAGSLFGSTNWGSANLRQLSVLQRERRTCNTCNTAKGSRPEYDLCSKRINILATVPIVIDRAEISRRNQATGRDWWTECGASPGADRFNTEAGTGFADPKQKTIAGVIQHERYHVSVSERLLRQRIQARNDIHTICPYRKADIQIWKSALEATIRADSQAFLQGNPSEVNEEINASNAECTRY